MRGIFNFLSGVGTVLLVICFVIALFKYGPAVLLAPLAIIGVIVVVICQR